MFTECLLVRMKLEWAPRVIPYLLCRFTRQALFLGRTFLLIQTVSYRREFTVLFRRLSSLILLGNPD